jgi:hypothetical protein
MLKQKLEKLAVALKSAPYVLVGQPNLRSPGELKGKKIRVTVFRFVIRDFDPLCRS